MNNNPKTQFESLCDLNFLGLWSQCESNWSSTIKQEIQEAINQPIKDQKSSPISHVILLGILTTLVFFGAATSTESPRIHQSVPKVGTHSVK